jgi:spore germination protein GerM
MVKRKTGKNRKGIPLGLLFWFAFFVVTGLLFFINAPKIKNTWNKVVAGKADVQTEFPPAQISQQPPVFEHLDFESSDFVSSDFENLDFEQPPIVSYETPPNTVNQTELVTRSKPESQPDVRPEQNYRDRKIYFVNVDSGGTVFISGVTRSVPSKGSPLVETLTALLQGTDANEKKQGLSSLVPEGTSVISARVEGHTAYINFNENFMFNSFGAEGYVAQLRQIIWTATEFPNISEVQILIEGRKVDFLGETLRIDHPINRDTF